MKDHKNFEISLGELLNALWKGKNIIIALTLLSSIYSLWYALSLPNIYKSSATLVAQNSSDQSRIPSNMQSFAGLAGLNFQENITDKTSLAIEIMQSFTFFKNLNEKHNILIPLMAVKGWDKESRELIYDNNVYDKKNEKWLKQDGATPSLQKGHKVFVNSMSISTNKENGIISLSIEHFSPDLAKEWVDLLISEINSNIKNRDVNKAESSIKFLTQEVAKTDISQIEERLYSLIQSQIETIMLANISEEYVFQTIDSAVSPEFKSSPNRSLLCIIGALLGFIIGAITSIIRHFSFF